MIQTALQSPARIAGSWETHLDNQQIRPHLSTFGCLFRQ